MRLKMRTYDVLENHLPFFRFFIIFYYYDSSHIKISPIFHTIIAGHI